MGMTFIGRRLSDDQLRALRDNPGLAPDLVYTRPVEPELDLDKSWHGIHFLLTGSAWETTPGAGESILGGRPIGPEGDYGPARLLDADTVRAVAAGLDAVDADTLRARFDPDAMTENTIYPMVWDGGDEEFNDYLLPYVDELRRFYRAAATTGQAVLVAVT
ncbi:YfbM family protein [Actinoplanes sp. N902-109]|uniref:YfbM family protein n=1 Tax=Actinoplanes sp. (strain N902-109) TaxID=649831 RepID=UPI000329476E|nr:YfbM family protein [Actinoplanes sp. N902-109]AGL19284.1 hypothetical protein L083_5774 [Actinoplanes sp. N902-109]